MKVGTMVRECSDWDIIYGIIIADESIDVQEELYKAKEYVYEKYGDDWSLEDVWEYLNEHIDYEWLDYGEAEV